MIPLLSGCARLTAPPPRTNRRLVVSIHDVAPPFEAEVRAQIDALARIGVTRCVLKVVPNWHGEWSLTNAPSLVALLRAQVEGGSELVLHGLEHRVHGSLSGPPWDRLRATLFAPATAEFLSLTYGQALQAAQRAARLVEGAGLPPPTTFCAPGWLLSPEARRALQAAGIRRLIGMFSVHDLETRRRRLLPSFGYMGVSPGQERWVRILNNLVCATMLPHASSAKAYLHPQNGAGNPALSWTLTQVERMITDSGWQPVTYADLDVND